MDRAKRATLDFFTQNPTPAQERQFQWCQTTLISHSCGHTQVSHEMRTRTRAPSPEPEEATHLLCGTKGAAKDASERVKALAIILFYKKLATGVGKMKAYAFAGEETNNSTQSVRGWVRLEDDLGMDGLESRRDNCGAVTRFSPSKKTRIDALMEETEGEPTQREIQAALGVGSHHTAASYTEQAGWKKAIKRLKTLLTAAHLEKRLLYVQINFEDEWWSTFMGDEKMFVLGLGNKTRYVRAEDDDERPVLKFVDNVLHPEQRMVIAVVGRPDPSKGFDGKVWIDWTCSEWKQAVRGSVNRPAGTWEIKTEKKEDGSVKGVTGESYEEMMVEYGFPHIKQAKELLELDEVTFQDDNAPAHAKAWGTGKGQLNLGKKSAEFGIRRGDQPD